MLFLVKHINKEQHLPMHTSNPETVYKNKKFNFFIYLFHSLMVAHAYFLFLTV
jgi:hypothetical protein